jgi:hypothetical protein
MIKDKTRYFIENSNCSVGVFVNRGFSVLDRRRIIACRSDEFLLRYARRLLKNNSQVSIQILDTNKFIENSEIIVNAVE